MSLKQYAYKYLICTELLEIVKWLQSFRKVDILVSPLFLSPTPTPEKRGGKKNQLVFALSCLHISHKVPAFAEFLEVHLTFSTSHPSQAQTEKCHFFPLLNQKLFTPMCQVFTTLCFLPLGSWSGIMTYILEAFVLFSITEKEGLRQ